MHRLLDSIRARFKGLRCRPGDVCWVRENITHPMWPGHIIVRGGTVVRVTRLSERGLWVLERPVPFAIVVVVFLIASGEVVAIADELLIPLRDKPGEDETLVARPVASPSVGVSRQPAEVS